MTNLDGQSLPRTFASIRFMSATLHPPSVTKILHVEPTLSYARGDVYVGGARQMKQERRFGAWIFSTEHVVTGALEDHCRFIADHCLMSDADSSALRNLLGRGDVDLTVAVYWFGKAGAAFPAIHPDFEKLVSDRGGRLETIFDRHDADAFRAA